MLSQLYIYLQHIFVLYMQLYIIVSQHIMLCLNYYIFMLCFSIYTHIICKLNYILLNLHTDRVS